MHNPNIQFLQTALMAICIYAFCSDIAVSKPVSIDKSNFFMLRNNDQVHYPVGVNASYLLDTGIGTDPLQKQLAQLTESGVNTLRIQVDHAHHHQKPVSIHRDGTLPESVLNRLKDICQIAQQHHTVVMISFFDIQTMVEDWEQHPYNQNNGGLCKTPRDFFTSPQQRALSSARIRQLIESLHSYDNLVWELGRGINADELAGEIHPEWRRDIIQWTLIQLDALQRRDPSHHLTALSFIPNSLPVDFLSLRQADLFLLQIQSGDPLRAVRSTQNMLQIIREYRRPVFIGELHWTGSSNQAQRFHQWMLWSAFAAGSSAFLHPAAEVHQEINSENAALLNSLDFAQPLFDLSGPPRPPANPKPSVKPADSYHLIESIIGYEWVFCLIRKTPGKSQATVEFQTKPGWYDYQWFHIEKTQILPSRSRKVIRPTLVLSSPEFEQIIIGRLRFLPEKESANPPEKANP